MYILSPHISSIPLAVSNDCKCVQGDLNQERNHDFQETGASVSLEFSPSLCRIDTHRQAQQISHRGRGSWPIGPKPFCIRGICFKPIYTTLWALARVTDLDVRP